MRALSLHVIFLPGTKRGGGLCPLDTGRLLKIPAIVFNPLEGQSNTGFWIPA